MNKKGLTLTIIFEAESANYGEGIGNVTALKKLSRGNGQFTYVSRQALRYNIVEQLSEELSPVEAQGSGDKKVIQYHPDATIEKYPEIDFFGYMKTKKGEGSITRDAKVRLSNAISLEEFNGDLDFLTNKGLADRIGENMNIAQSEIHRSYYRYTINIDLDEIGVDENENINLPKEEKSRRIEKLLDTIAFLYRDIKGRREDLKPLFAIGGVYDIKNPFFQNVVEVKGNRIKIDLLQSVLEYEHVKENTICGIVKGKFSNESEIIEKLNAISIPELFKNLKERVKNYYEGN
ncbi:CRISPR-associated protein Cst2 [Marinitoga hydrogenitolerans DSM 16785]|uniref:CRISPR-associated protein Cst2 n=1 Tax=Marinitoga hydrogenitolerans (strain DSM 16785 / JCM 12826 / AT1271) TaxID=1122195 RepID=A0A1M4Z445_MARH1|nr:type I-B CRISPR-associated protein Cas7/Cst2/DevR [Marinitoga hydrogenitolerans]SHF12728.1 CRISPR-associated protein Cst2 [Marinitoga hydrogenitolerans DSM 16785]